ncbi:MAG: hypothetical protein WCL44_08785 [bacterium]
MTISVSDIFFALVAFAAVVCFGVLLHLQIAEDTYYKDPLSPGGNIWPQVTLQAPGK